MKALVSPKAECYFLLASNILKDLLIKEKAVWIIESNKTFFFFNDYFSKNRCKLKMKLVKALTVLKLKQLQH